MVVCGHTHTTLLRRVARPDGRGHTLHGQPGRIGLRPRADTRRRPGRLCAVGLVRAIAAGRRRSARSATIPHRCTPRCSRSAAITLSPHIIANRMRPARRGGGAGGEPRFRSAIAGDEPPDWWDNRDACRPGRRLRDDETSDEPLPHPPAWRSSRRRCCSINFFGFAYAHLVRPGQLALNPFRAAVTAGQRRFPGLFRLSQRRPSRFDLGAMPPAEGERRRGRGRGELADVWPAGISVGAERDARRRPGRRPLCALPGRRDRAGMSERPAITSWLTILTTVGLAMPGFYIGSLLIMARPGISGVGAGYVFAAGSGFRLGSASGAARAGVGCSAHRADRADDRCAAGGRTGQDVRGGRAQRRACRGIRSAAVMRCATSLRRSRSRCSARLRLMVGELIVVEWLFSWPGLGRLLAFTLIPPQVTSGGRPMFLHPPTLAAVLTVLAALFLLGDLGAGLMAAASILACARRCIVRRGRTHD